MFFGAPINAHLRSATKRAHITLTHHKLQQKTPILVNGSFVFFSADAFRGFLETLRSFGSTRLYSAGQSERAASSAITVQLV